MFLGISTRSFFSFFLLFLFVLLHTFLFLPQSAWSFRWVDGRFCLDPHKDAQDLQIYRWARAVDKKGLCAKKNPAYKYCYKNPAERSTENPHYMVAKGDIQWVNINLAPDSLAPLHSRCAWDCAGDDLLKLREIENRRKKNPQQISRLLAMVDLDEDKAVCGGTASSAAGGTSGGTIPGTGSPPAPHPSSSHTPSVHDDKDSASSSTTDADADADSASTASGASDCAQATNSTISDLNKSIEQIGAEEISEQLQSFHDDEEEESIEHTREAMSLRSPGLCFVPPLSNYFQTTLKKIPIPHLPPRLLQTIAPQDQAEAMEAFLGALLVQDYIFKRTSAEGLDDYIQQLPAECLADKEVPERRKFENKISPYLYRNEEASTFEFPAEIEDLKLKADQQKQICQTLKAAQTAANLKDLPKLSEIPIHRYSMQRLLQRKGPLRDLYFSCMQRYEGNPQLGYVLKRPPPSLMYRKEVNKLKKSARINPHYRRYLTQARRYSSHNRRKSDRIFKSRQRWNELFPAQDTKGKLQSNLSSRQNDRLLSVLQNDYSARKRLYQSFEKTLQHWGLSYREEKEYFTTCTDWTCHQLKTYLHFKKEVVAKAPYEGAALAPILQKMHLRPAAIATSRQQLQRMLQSLTLLGQADKAKALLEFLESSYQQHPQDTWITKQDIAKWHLLVGRDPNKIRFFTQELAKIHPPLLKDLKIHKYFSGQEYQHYTFEQLGLHILHLAETQLNSLNHSPPTPRWQQKQKEYLQLYQLFARANFHRPTPYFTPEEFRQMPPVFRRDPKISEPQKPVKKDEADEAFKRQHFIGEGFSLSVELNNLIETIIQREKALVTRKDWSNSLFFNLFKRFNPGLSDEELKQKLSDLLEERVPLGFENATQYQEFINDFKTFFKAQGLQEGFFGIRGSSTTYLSKSVQKADISVLRQLATDANGFYQDFVDKIKNKSRADHFTNEQLLQQFHFFDRKIIAQQYGPASSAIASMPNTAPNLEDFAGGITPFEWQELRKQTTYNSKGDFDFHINIPQLSADFARQGAKSFSEHTRVFFARETLMKLPQLAPIKRKWEQTLNRQINFSVYRPLPAAAGTPHRAPAAEHELPSYLDLVRMDYLTFRCKRHSFSLQDGPIDMSGCQ